jgi:hypothetical protein
MAYTAIDFDILLEISDEKTVLTFKNLGVKQVLNISKWIEINGRNPSYGSIFVVGGGSYILADSDDECISIYNGTLQNVPGINISKLSKYYHRKAFGSDIPK